MHPIEELPTLLPDGDVVILRNSVNGKYLSEREREDLAFFKVIKSIVEGYRKLLAGTNDDNLN